ncbi:NUDIX hydrolase [Anaerovorax odorimutans]|uniref:NUDIX hydrolase n=1 Tax=Anaerovorax odorimutans TaxID=109327 RepID=A0ABT1RJM9_9FIRM|nr:NUDIX hydrolase [Anaerovorax odorimutans]MCQ4635384.1 NUDIX hydrolase [Anaerovorax odorimutans]
MVFEEKKISSERIYEGAILNLRKDTVTAPKGTAYREIVEHNGAVAIVPITDEGKLVMVKQFRYPSGKVILEIPAGKIDEGETDPLQTARRELKEETGYAADSMHYLGKINPSVAYTEEVIHLYAATGLTPGETSFDDDEALDILEYDFKEAYQMAACGQMVDAKTIAAIFMAKEQLGIK